MGRDKEGEIVCFEVDAGTSLGTGARKLSVTCFIPVFR